jgi:hypothetical protein
VGLLYGLYGYPLVAIAKVVLLAGVTAIGAILINREGTAKLAVAVLAIGILIGLAGGISNTIAIGALPLV